VLGGEKNPTHPYNWIYVKYAMRRGLNPPRAPAWWRSAPAFEKNAGCSQNAIGKSIFQHGKNAMRWNIHAFDVMCT
jgi:hypothetical protein